jgi:hypothetical protein
VEKKDEMLFLFFFFLRYSAVYWSTGGGRATMRNRKKCAAMHGKEEKERRKRKKKTERGNPATIKQRYESKEKKREKERNCITRRNVQSPVSRIILLPFTLPLHLLSSPLLSRCFVWFYQLAYCLHFDSPS